VRAGAAAAEPPAIGPGERIVAGGALGPAGAVGAACVFLSALAVAPAAGAVTLPKALAAEVPGKPLVNCIKFDDTRVPANAP